MSLSTLALSFSLVSAAAAPPDAATPPPAASLGSSVLLWQRVAGPATKDVRGASVVVRLDALPVAEKTLRDVRGSALHVRGATLSDLLARAPFDASVDGVVLRFENGVHVLLARKDVASFGLFIARAWKVSESGAWSTELERVPLVSSRWHEGRALEFHGNRVLLEHPDPPRGAGSFAPWGYVDSLVEIEGLRMAAWHDVFDVGATPQTRDGLAVFERRCASCHGVRGAGARLGWDYVDPLPVPEFHDAASLLVHVRSHKLNDAELGLIMPAQPDMSPAEGEALFAWMMALPKAQLHEYRP